MVRLLKQRNTLNKYIRAAGGKGHVRERTLAVVDIGSNTVHLLVARTNGRNIETLVDMSEGLRLGSEVDYDGLIGPEKLEELITTLKGFVEASAEAGVERPRLLATHAIRTATNREEVRRAIGEATDLPLEILSTGQEAAFSFVGADLFSPSIGPQVVVDIGGGSMQVVVGQNGQVWDSVSLPLGATRIANRFLPSDPPTYIEEALLVTYLANVIPSALPLRETDLTGLVGVGGTLRRTPQLLGFAPGETLPNDAIESLICLLRPLSAQEIASRYNLRPERARIILPALLVIREVLRGYDWPPLIISGYGMREGAILCLARGGE
jgi:exopolyphosphatase/guanosine-5'-triphosphate,3'-diphosphate pyrophosphatase